MPGWQEFLDIARKDVQVKSVGIFGQDGVTWAATDDLNVTAAEVHNLVAGVHDNNKLHENGVVVGGTKYLFVAPLDADSPDLAGVLGHKGATSVEVILTRKAVVVATTEGYVSELTGPAGLALQLLKVGF